MASSNWGGARPGAGRPKGTTTNEANKRLRELAQTFTNAGIEELARIGGLHREPIEKADGQPVMVPVLNPDGTLVLNPDGTPMMKAKMRRVAGSSSDMARISAISTIFDRGHGKAKQPLANDEENPLTSVRPNGIIELEEVAVGTPLVLSFDNSDEIISEEEAPTSVPANDQKVA
jgi:hypothetical protein